jgi:Fur family ferric uptake transcriptional regulator
MVGPKPPKRLEAIRQALRQAGLRATPSRIAVLEYLQRARGPVSHPDLVAAFDTSAWDRTTLYRNLLDLERAGLARRTQLGDRLWRFEPTHSSHPAGDHPHFVCTECGRIECLPQMKVSLSPARAGPKALQHRQVEIQLRGCCDDCR